MKWRFAATLLLLSALVVGLSLAAGRWGGESKSIDWELAGIIGTALGTTLLAAATGVLAFSTWRDVTATQQLVALTASDMESREKPIIRATLLGKVGPNDAPNLKVEFHNIGKGPAVDLTVRAGWTDNTGTEFLAAPFKIQPINQGGMESVEVPLPTPAAGTPLEQLPAFVEGTYTDRSGTRQLTLVRTT